MRSGGECEKPRSMFVTATNPSSSIATMVKCAALLAALVGSAAAFAPAQVPAARSAVSLNMAEATDEYYIDQDRRNLMNLILVGSAAVTIGGLAVPYIAFFVPPSSGSGAGGVPAKNALGDDLFAKDYLAEKPVGDRSLAQGLKGDAT